MEIEAGKTFYSIYFPGRVEVLAVDEEKNELQVKITKSETS